jgi:integrase
VTRHSKELALDDREFELLLDGARRLDDYQGQQARFAILVAGRLGLRAGEVAHMRESWLNWRTRRIEIPSKEPCTKGKSEGICGYCEQAAKQMVRYNAIDEAEARLELLQEGEIKGFRPDTERQLLVAHRRFADDAITETSLDDQINTILEASPGDEYDIYEALCSEGEALVSEQDITLDEARDMMWKPKTTAAVREVPFDWRARVEISVERFFDRFDGWPLSRSALTRRVKKSLRHADELDEKTTHLHGLRATAATHHAGRGVSTLTLQSLLGWAQASTARAYVRASPDNTQRELHQANSR